MPAIDALADRLSTYLDADQVNLVRRAYFYAEQAHDGQRRRSGEAYVTHPLAVANILADMHMDHQSLMAAMLHDVIEDTGVSKKALAAQFGKPVAELVDGVSKLTQITFEDKAVAQAENFQKMVLAMSRDIRVIIVKLADRLHNMRTLGALRPEKRRRIARETLLVFAPLARLLGMHTIQTELEELSFMHAAPDAYHATVRKLDELAATQEETVLRARGALAPRPHRARVQLDAKVLNLARAAVLQQVAPARLVDVREGHRALEREGVALVGAARVRVLLGRLAERLAAAGGDARDAALAVELHQLVGDQRVGHARVVLDALQQPPAVAVAV